MTYETTSIKTKFIRIGDCIFDVGRVQYFSGLSENKCIAFLESGMCLHFDVGLEKIIDLLKE
jgi:hypothetical protein